MTIVPEITLINSRETPWPEDVQRRWEEKVVPRFRPGERCSRANYFTPRPYVDEWNRGSDKVGFVYIVLREDRALSCMVDWNKEEEK